jgi:hypothetical protein
MHDSLAGTIALAGTSAKLCGPYADDEYTYMFKVQTEDRTYNIAGIVRCAKF